MIKTIHKPITIAAILGLVATIVVGTLTSLQTGWPNYLSHLAYGQQQENATGNVTGAQPTTGKIPSLSTPGEKTFYMFTSEVENVDETKLKVAGDSFSVHTLVVNKGDKVTVNFYNVDDVKTERHSFTIGEPYKVDIDLGFAQNGNATFTADHTGVFAYYCRYHLPVMTGQLIVLP